MSEPFQGRRTTLWMLGGIALLFVAACVLCACGGVLLLTSSNSTARTQAERRDGKGEASTVLSGNYPPPTRQFRGRNAEEWGRQACDTDQNACREACEALNHLGAEGIPFLLYAASVQEAYPENLSQCLLWCHGSVVAESDLPRIAHYLDDSYSKYDERVEGNVRASAISSLGQARSKGRPYLSRIQALSEKPPLKHAAELAIRLITQ